MARTTLNIDTPVLEEIKRMQRREGVALGQLVSRLLTEALARRQGEVSEGIGFDWIAQPMGARLDLDDKEAVYAVLDRDDRDDRSGGDGDDGGDGGDS